MALSGLLNMVERTGTDVFLFSARFMSLSTSFRWRSSLSLTSLAFLSAVSFALLCEAGWIGEQEKFVSTLLCLKARCLRAAGRTLQQTRDKMRKSRARPRRGRKIRRTSLSSSLHCMRRVLHQVAALRPERLVGRQEAAGANAPAAVNERSTRRLLSIFLGPRAFDAWRCHKSWMFSRLRPESKNSRHFRFLDFLSLSGPLDSCCQTSLRLRSGRVFRVCVRKWGCLHHPAGRFVPHRAKRTTLPARFGQSCDLCD